MDTNTSKVLLAAIPSGAFVIIVALVIFGLSPGECIEIEAPGGGKVTKCKPLPDSESVLSTNQIDSLVNQIEELKVVQDTQQQQQLNQLKQNGMIEATPSNFMTASSIFEDKRDSLSEQLQFLSSDESALLSKKITDDKQKINRLNKIAEDMISGPRLFLWTGTWQVTGTVGIFDLPYKGQIIFNDDGTYESNGTLDGKYVSGSGTYLIDGQLATCTLYPDDSKPIQYSFVDLSDNSFIMWAPLNFEQLEFQKSL